MIKFGDKEIKNYGEPYIIAEIGANHNGDIELAKKMIDVAKEKGADCVKFQSWSKNSIFAKKKYEDNYFLEDDYRDRDDHNLESIIDEYSINKKEQRILKEYCDKKSIGFASTPFSKEEVDFLVDELDVNFIKIASMDLNNYPFLEYIAQKGKPIVLSTGLSKLSEIEKGINTILNQGNEDLILLHCVSNYPVKYEEVNLNNIDMLRDLFDVPVGFSDHTLGYSVPLLSVAKGVCLIEKHFTLDKNMEGWDHEVSANPEELEVIAKESKKIYKSLGSYKRVVNESDEKIKEFRRSIVLNRDMEAGEIIKKEDLEFKRPGTGIKPGELKYVVGRQLENDKDYDELLKWDDLV